MDLLKEHHLNELTEINKELDELDKKSSKIKTMDGFDLRDGALGTHMEKFNKNLIHSKNKKFDKEARAFHMERAYRWNQGNLGSRPRMKSMRDDIAPDHRFSSSGSETDGSGSLTSF